MAGKFRFGKGGGATKAPKPPKEKKPRGQRLAQLRQVYTLAQRGDPRIGLWMALAVAGVLLLGFFIGLAVGHPYYATFVALPLAFLAAVLLMSRRAEKAAYSALDGQPGAGGAALQGLKKGWSYQQEPIAVDGGRTANLQNAAMVYRAVGRAGVVLIGEGPAGRSERLLQTEQRKVTRLVPNVPITTYRIGTGSGDNVVATRELVSRMGKMKNVLTKQEVAAVDKRLRALARVKPPIPAGMDPQRMKSMGRGQRR
ncbi:MAG: DUF4191 domain-containing protein [Micrococcales bacterium]|nr:DUF4191 domain-containing protein [Micrococcales bacterium]